MTGPGPVGAVLAGGAGRRLGGDKAIVPLAGRALVLHALGTVGEVLRDRAVVVKETTRLPPLPAGVAVWREATPDPHPLHGVAEALRRARGRDVLVLPVDLPLMTPDVLRALLGAAAGTGAVVARCDGRLQPLLARYPAAALAALEAAPPAVAATAFAASLSPAVVDVPGDCALNVNTRADLARAEALLASRT